MRRSPRSAMCIGRVLLATVLLTPMAAQAQLGGLRKKLEQKITEAVVPKKAESLPPSFSDARYEITTARFDGLLRGATLADEAQARYERNLTEKERKELQAERENAELERSTERMASRFTPSASGPMGCQVEVMTLLDTLPEKDPRRVKGEAMMDRLEKLMEETERRERTGQRVDTVGTALRSMALLDSVAITVRGAPCKKITKADVDQNQRAGEAMMADMQKAQAQGAQMAKTQQEIAALNTSAPNRSDIIAREAGLSGVQMGVVCDKLIAFLQASNRKQEIQGFSAAEQALLSKRLPELRKNGKQFCSGFPD